MTFDATGTTTEHILPTIEQEYKILAELKMIESDKLYGIYVIPSYNNSLMWYGVVFVRHGYFMGAVFRFNVCLPDTFPNDKVVPNIVFQSEVYHPLVCPFTGTLDTSSAFTQWRPGENHIWQLLKYIQYILSDGIDGCILCYPDIAEWANKEAADILHRDREAFALKAKQCAECSKMRVYDGSTTPGANSEDPHYIMFDEYKEDIHNSTKQCIREGRALFPGQSSGLAAAKGLSWVKEGSLSAFSAE